MKYYILALSFFLLQPSLAAPQFQSAENQATIKRTINFHSDQSLGVLFVYKNVPDEDCQTSRITSGKFVGKAVSTVVLRVGAHERLAIALSKFGLEHAESLEKITANSLDAVIIDSFGSDDEEIEDPRLASALAYISKRLDVKELYIDKTSIRDYQLSQLSSMKNLERFSSSMNMSFSGDCFKYLCQASKLHTLGVLLCALKGENLAFLKSMSALRVLKIPDNDLHGGLCHLPLLQHLEELDLHGCKIHDGDVAYLSRVKTLKRLDLGHCFITDRSLSLLAKLPNLQSLNLEENNVSYIGLINLLKTNRHLSALTVSDRPMPENRRKEMIALLPKIVFARSRPRAMNEDTKKIFAPISKDAGL